jgi:hypothetical protein
VSSQAFFLRRPATALVRIVFLTASLCLVADARQSRAQDDPPTAAIDWASTDAGSNVATVPETIAVHPNESFHRFVAETFMSPYPYASAVAGATLDQITRFPNEWQGSPGFTKRTAARVAQGFVSDTIAHGTATLLHQHIDYDPCQCSGTMARTRHAMSRAFVAVRYDGSPAPNWPLWISNYSSSTIANAWYPGSYTRRDVVIHATSAVAISAGLNILREFGHFK